MRVSRAAFSLWRLHHHKPLPKTKNIITIGMEACAQHAGEKGGVERSLAGGLLVVCVCLCGWAMLVWEAYEFPLQRFGATGACVPLLSILL